MDCVDEEKRKLLNMDPETTGVGLGHIIAVILKRSFSRVKFHFLPWYLQSTYIPDEIRYARAPVETLYLHSFVHSHLNT